MANNNTNKKGPKKGPRTLYKSFLWGRWYMGSYVVV